jgi:hypothetical protein
VLFRSAHDHRAADAIWLVKKYDPAAYFIQLYKIEPKEKIGIISIRCRALQARRTKVRVTYEYIALSAKGERFVSKFNDDAYGIYIGEWRKLLTTYFGSKG